VFVADRELDPENVFVSGMDRASESPIEPGQVFIAGNTVVVSPATPGMAESDLEVAVQVRAPKDARVVEIFWTNK
jgi:hypothetical protein